MSKPQVVATLEITLDKEVYRHVQKNLGTLCVSIEQDVARRVQTTLNWARATVRPVDCHDKVMEES